MQPSLGQNQFQNPEEVYKAVIQVVNKNKSSDLFHKAFLRPQQIALKTWRTQNDTSKPHDALPYGLKQVIKKDISLNKYVLTDFQSFDSLQPQNRNINFIVQKNYDNLISLIKPKGAEQKIKLCICICMYSQDKTMLRKTLAGVSNNIATFVHNGVSADDIVVAVVMDGIEKVHPTVVDFFGQMEKQSNIYLDDQVQVMEAKQMMKDTINQIDQEEVINISNFIFDQIEFQDRKKRRFAQRKRQYQQVKGMRNKIQKLQLNKKIIYDDLDGFLKPFFLEKARQFRKRDAVDEGLQIDRMTQEQLIQYYSNNLKICRPVIFAALSQAKSYCQKYIQTRDNLALLNSFRFQVNFGSFDQIKKKSKSYQQVNQQDRNRDRNTRMNLFLITKYKNSGKLSSHNWFFNGLCREIKTQYAILLDVGLCPEKTALFKMYEHMKQESRCGGVCGYMNLRIQRLQDEDEKHLSQVDCLSRLFSHCTDIQRAQQVQYHFAHLIDKPFQALFKFIHVLPGAFSAYRMKALQPSQEEDSKLMREYFKSLEQSTSRELKKTEYSAGKAVLKVLLPDFLYYCIYPTPKQMTQQQLLYDSNVYLAEDRTLCMGIHQNGYQLQYLPDAHAWVDPIKHLHGLLGQRKRWINGSFFAFQSVKKGLGEQNSGDCCLKLQIFYLTLMNMLAFVSPALFLFTVHIAMFAFRDWVYGTLLQQITYTEFYATQFYNSFVYLMDFIYVMLMLGLVFKSMHFTHRTERFIPYIYIMSTIMGMFSIAVFIVLFYDMILGIIDSILCLNPENQCTITFLAQVPVLRQKFFELLPGGVFTFMIYKWLVVGVVSLYIIPILVYGLFYCRIQFLMDVLFGTFSFLYYTPTYLNILNTFALCRIDDISWGTKGLDAEDNRNNNLKQSWKSIKILHVAKFVFWNVIVGAVMLIISSPINLKGLITPDQYNDLLVDSYIRKFFMTFFLMAIIGFALFLKIILGAMYTISYRCSHHKSQKRLYNEGSFNNQSRADKYFLQIKQSMNTQLKDYIYGIVDNVKKKKLTKGLSINNFNSIIVANKKYTDGASRKKAQEKWNNNVSNRSKVEKKNEKKPRPSIKPNIVNVQPQAIQPKPIQPQLVTNSPNNPKAPLVAPQPQQVPRNTLQQPQLQPQPQPQPPPQPQSQPQPQVQQMPRNTLQPQPQVQPQVQQVSRSTLPQPQPQQIPRSTSPQPQPRQGQSNLNVPVANNIQNQRPRSPSPTPNSNPNVNPNQRSSPQISNSTSPNTSQMPTQSSNPNPKLINPSQQKPLNQNPYSNPIPNQYPIQNQNQIPNQYPVQYPNQQPNPNQRPSSSQIPNQPVRNPNQPVTTSNLRPPSQYPGQTNNQYPQQNPQFTQKNVDNSTQQLRVPDNRTTPRRTPGSSELKIVSDQMNSEAELKKSQLDNINGAVNPPKKIFGLF